MLVVARLAKGSHLRKERVRKPRVVLVVARLAKGSHLRKERVRKPRVVLVVARLAKGSHLRKERVRKPRVVLVVGRMAIQPRLQGWPTAPGSEMPSSVRAGGLRKRLHLARKSGLRKPKQEPVVVWLLLVCQASKSRKVVVVWLQPRKDRCQPRKESQQEGKEKAAPVASCCVPSHQVQEGKPGQPGKGGGVVATAQEGQVPAQERKPGQPAKGGGRVATAQEGQVPAQEGKAGQPGKGGGGVQSQQAQVGQDSQVGQTGKGGGAEAKGGAPQEWQGWNQWNDPWREEGGEWDQWDQWSSSQWSSQWDWQDDNAPGEKLV